MWHCKYALLWSRLILLGNNSLIEVLGFNWGNSYSSAYYAVCDLLREGVADKLYVANPCIDYHYSGTNVIQMVNAALASGNHNKMHSVTQLLCQWNNAYNPF